LPDRPRNPSNRAPHLGNVRVLARIGLAKTTRVIKRVFDRRRWYCSALAGESNYNICVNSDMTVSCNCQDFDGQGHIGDLRTQTLAEIFSGDVVSRFQSTLFNRRFPTSNCSFCPELAPLPKAKAKLGPARGAVPVHGLMIENTVLCNLRCGLCRRDELLAGRRQKSLTLDDVAHLADMVAEYGIERVSYFSLGEPFASRTIREEVALLRNRNPNLFIVTSTNGALMDTDDKLDAALMMDMVFFSIDGSSQEALVRYQVGGDFERSYRNMRRLVERRATVLADNPSARVPEIEWKYVLFRWNDSEQDTLRAIDLARKAGVDRITFYPGVAAHADRSVRFYSDPFIKDLGPLVNGGVVVDLTASSA